MKTSFEIRLGYEALPPLWPGSRAMTTPVSGSVVAAAGAAAAGRTRSAAARAKEARRVDTAAGSVAEGRPAITRLSVAASSLVAGLVPLESVAWGRGRQSA